MQHHPHVYVIFWGNSWAEKPGVQEKILQLYGWLNGSAYASALSQYFDYSGPYSGDNTLAGSYVDTRSDPTGITEAGIRAEIRYVIEQRGWPKGNYENQYVVFASPNSTLAGGEAGYCGYHNWWGEGWSVPLTFVPWPGQSPNGCNYGGAWDPWEVLQVVASHEWAETVTDPIPEEGYSGWDNTHWVECPGECGSIMREYFGYCTQYFCVAGEEIADVCETADREPNGNVWLFRVFDDYLAASEAHIDCVLHDTGPARFSVGLYSPNYNTSTHQMEMRGGINPVGWAANYQFQLTHGTETQLTPSEPSEFAGNYQFSPVLKSANTLPLKGSTTYHVTLNSASELTTPNSWNVYGAKGPFAFKGEADFTTPDWRPIVEIQSATNRTLNSADVNATVNPQGFASAYHFEWGTTKSYGKSVPIPDGQLEAGAGAVSVSQHITGLKPETTYHYRIVAANIEGTSVSGDKIFTTLAKPPVYNFTFGSLGTKGGQFSSPTGAAVDGSGNVWVADTANNRIEKFSSKGEILAQFGTKGSANGQLLEPHGIAITSAGNLWVADSGNGRIEEFTPSGEFLRTFGDIVEGGWGTEHLLYPWGIAIDSRGLIWVTDTSEHAISRFEEGAGTNHYKGSFTQFGWGGNEEHLNKPTGIAADKEGNVWFVDSSQNWLGRITEEETPWGPSYPVELVTQKWGSGEGQLLEPYGVAAKPSGTLLVAEKGTNRVQQLGPGGEYLVQFGSSGSGAGQLSSPQGIATGPGGTIYVVDSGNNRVERWNQPTSPTATTQAASGIKATEATVNGIVNPGGEATTYQFEYGLTTAYGSKVPASPASVGAGADPVSVNQTLTGLKAETTYHFRVVATNPEGVAYGEDKTFSTIGPPFDFSFGSAGSGAGQFSGPAGLAVDSSGNVWVVDRANSRLEKFSASGGYLSQFGSKGSANGQFNEPRDVAISPSGNLWVADTGNGRLQEFSSSGAFIRQVGITEGSGFGGVDHLKEPTGVAIGAENRVWVSDPGSCAVELFSETSSSSNYYVGQQKAQGLNPCSAAERGAFQRPAGIGTDSEGNAWVADGALNRVTKLTATKETNPFGEVVIKISAPTMFGTQGSGNGQFIEPTGVAVVSPGKLSVVDRGNSRVEQFSTSGEYQRQFGSLGSGAGQFSNPWGVAVAPGGAQFVTDGGNNRVQKWG